MILPVYMLMWSIWSCEVYFTLAPKGLSSKKLKHSKADRVKR